MGFEVINFLIFKEKVILFIKNVSIVYLFNVKEISFGSYYIGRIMWCDILNLVDMVIWVIRDL